LGITQRFGFTAEDAFRGMIDTSAQFIDVRARCAFRLAGLRQKAALHQPRADVKLAVGVHLVRAPDDVIKLLGQERLGGFGLFGHCAHSAH
jgi:hypothetical protein